MGNHIAAEDIISPEVLSHMVGQAAIQARKEERNSKLMRFVSLNNFIVNLNILLTKDRDF